MECPVPGILPEMAFLALSVQVCGIYNLYKKEIMGVNGTLIGIPGSSPLLFSLYELVGSEITKVTVVLYKPI